MPKTSQNPSQNKVAALEMEVTLRRDYNSLQDITIGTFRELITVRKTELAFLKNKKIGD